ncbi:hypothetical protein F4804DRAFT_339491 [Jackrogersella minutella]|nr:hypothetical protein F4804DRAFT_339491 [Jackrogersella minutella]
MSDLRTARQALLKGAMKEERKKAVLPQDKIDIIWLRVTGLRLDFFGIINVETNNLNRILSAVTYINYDGIEASLKSPSPHTRLEHLKDIDNENSDSRPTDDDGESIDTSLLYLNRKDG